MGSGGDSLHSTYFRYGRVMLTYGEPCATKTRAPRARGTHKTNFTPDMTFGAHDVSGP